jgi:hypothetical protein
VLQYRSVAFVTYVYEGNAQFAKEAMACQSLDNDEILNVRWATEDPNPETKVAEKRRLEEMGQEAVRARLDSRIVDAVRAMRALEDGDSLDAEGNLIENGDADDAEDDDDGQRDGKRRRIEGPSEEEQERLMEESLREIEGEQPKGLLNSDTLEGLRYFAEIRKRSVKPPAAVPKTSVKPATPALGLMDYGSDEE